MVHQKDLEQFTEMLDQGAIGNLQPGRQDYWSLERKEDHARKSVEGGGCKVGKMADQEKEDHAHQSVEGGGSEVGKMAGQEKEDHVRKNVEGGASKQGAQGPMTGIDLQKHRELMTQGYTAKPKLMMQLANGKEGQDNMWKCSDSNHGTAILYHFCAENEHPIDGVRHFEKYLIDAKNGFVPDKLTTAGAEVLISLKRMRDNVVTENASRKQKNKQAVKVRCARSLSPRFQFSPRSQFRVYAERPLPSPFSGTHCRGKSTRMCSPTRMFSLPLCTHFSGMSIDRVLSSHPFFQPSWFIKGGGSIQSGRERERERERERTI